MSTPLVFWIDSANNKLAGGWNSFVYSGMPTFKQGDSVEVLLRWIKRPTLNTSFMEEIPFGTADISFDVGNVAWKPTDGKWYLNYDDYSTDLIENNAPAEDVELALNSVTSIVEAGGVSVIRSNDDGYKVIFEENGTRLPLSGYGEALIPTSNVVVTTVSSGSSTTKAVYWITLRQTTVTEEVGDWETEAPCEASVQQLKPDVWDVYLTSQPQDGEFSISIDGGDPIVIDIYAHPSTVQEDIGVGYTVSKQGDFRWRIKNDSEDAFVVVIEDDSNLISFNGKKNTILFDNQLISEMLSGNSVTTAMLEIAVTETGNRQTLLSIPCSITSKTTV